MSKYSSKNAAFQFGLLLFMVAGLSMGIILTTGKASLIFSPSAQVVDYTAKPPVPPGESNMGRTLPKCISDGGVCLKNKVCCGFCDNGVCNSICVQEGLRCDYRGSKCCPGTKCKGLIGYKYCRK